MTCGRRHHPPHINMLPSLGTAPTVAIAPSAPDAPPLSPLKLLTLPFALPHNHCRQPSPPPPPPAIHPLRRCCCRSLVLSHRVREHSQKRSTRRLGAACSRLSRHLGGIYLLLYYTIWSMVTSRKEAAGWNSLYRDYIRTDVSSKFNFYWIKHQKNWFLAFFIWTWCNWWWNFLSYRLGCFSKISFNEYSWWFIVMIC